MMQQLLENALRSLLVSQGFNLPVQGFTLEHVEPSNDRVVVQISHFLQGVCQTNIVTAAVFNVARPVVDSTLSKSLGVVKAASAKSQVVGHQFIEVKRKARRKLGKKPRIIDAEFVMIDEKRKAK